MLEEYVRIVAGYEFVRNYYKLRVVFDVGSINRDVIR